MVRGVCASGIRNVELSKRHLILTRKVGERRNASRPIAPGSAGEKRNAKKKAAVKV